LHPFDTQLPYRFLRATSSSGSGRISSCHHISGSAALSIAKKTSAAPKIQECVSEKLPQEIDKNIGLHSSRYQGRGGRRVWDFYNDEQSFLLFFIGMWDKSCTPS